MDYIFKRDPKEYGTEYKAHLLEQYKLYLKGIDDVNVRRQKANDFFLTINTSIFAFIGIMSKFADKNFFQIAVFICVIGVSISFFWYKLVKSYQKINRGKYKLLDIIEDELPISFHKSEWAILRDKPSYTPITDIEIKIPLMFIAFYLLLSVCLYFL